MNQFIKVGLSTPKPGYRVSRSFSIEKLAEACSQVGDDRWPDDHITPVFIYVNQ